MEDLTGKVTSDTLSASEFVESVAREMLQFVTDAGFTPSAGDPKQFVKALAGFFAVGGWFEEAAGSAADVYKVQVTGAQQAPTELLDGMKLSFRPSNASLTTTPTLAVGSLAAKTVVTEAGAALAVGDLNTGRDVEVRYDLGSDKFFLLTSSALASDSTDPRGYISGLTKSNNSVDDLHDIDFAAGVSRASDDSIPLTNNSTLVKRIDATWAAGTAAGGLSDNDSLTSDTWYHCFALSKAAGGIDFGFTADATGADLLSDAAVVVAGFDKIRRVGAVLSDSSSNILPFIQFNGNEFWWNPRPATNDVFDTNPGTSQQQATVLTPLGVSTVFIGNMTVGETNSGAIRYIAFGFGDETIPTVSADMRDAEKSGASATTDDLFTRIPTNTSSEVSYRLATSASTVNIKMLTHGWVDPRGGE